MILLEELQRRIKLLRKSGKKIVFTNGCFDIIHRGHIKVLKEAKERGDFLIVGLNSDSSVKRLKGSGRPVNKETDRKIVLEAIRYVDSVVIFKEDTPLNLIMEIKPDVLVKGADYGKDEIVGEKEVLSWRGKVVRVKLLHGLSTTKIIRMMNTE